MVINNNIIELVWEVDNAGEFMKKCPLTIGGLKGMFITDHEINTNEYLEYLSDNELRDEEESLFRFLVDLHSFADSEIIEEILEKEKEEYYWEFDDHDGRIDGYFKIYKVNRGKDGKN